MDAYWFQKLINVLRVQTNSENEKLMVLYLDKELRKLKLPYTIDAAGNILVTKGKAKTYPCVVSHMDTVHSFVPNFNVYQDIDDNDTLFALNGKERVGVGGDDKCGVFVCLYLLKTIPQIKIVFFSREEKGCAGSRAIDKTFFANCRYLIQLDRRGSRDFIQTYWSKKTISHEFSSEIGLIKKKYRYKNAIGTVTDVMRLWDDKIGISCINLSCGYYQPHTNWEYVSIKGLWNSVKFTEEIVNNMQPKRYASLPPKPTVVTTVTRSLSNYDKCSVCKGWKVETLLYKVKGSKEKICWSCKQGKESNYKRLQCDRCLIWFLEDTMVVVGEHTLCKSCTAKSTKAHDSTLTDPDTILFLCHECGKRTDEMKKGDSLRYYTGDDSHLYCNECALVLFAASEETPPEKCYVCSKVIPKDHQVIERFGVRVCEYCATQEELTVN